MANVDVKIGRKTFSLSAETEYDKKKLLDAASLLDNYSQQFLKANPAMTNEEAMMFSAISMAHEYESLKQEKESNESMLEKMHNSLAERIEKLL